MATRFEHPDDPAAEIYYLGNYVPWGWHKMFIGGLWDADSSRVLDVKKSKEYALKHYENEIFNKIATTYVAVCAIPGHDPVESDNTGVRLLAQRLAGRLKIADGRQFLRRVKPVDKLADGGSRALDIHLKSIEAQSREIYRGGKVLLLDDVLTSGNSMLACRRILLDAGAADVICLALGKTKH